MATKTVCCPAGPAQADTKQVAAAGCGSANVVEGDKHPCVYTCQDCGAVFPSATASVTDPAAALELWFDPDDLREHFATREHPAADASDEVLRRIGEQAMENLRAAYDYAVEQAAESVKAEIEKEGL